MMPTIRRSGVVQSSDWNKNGAGSEHGETRKLSIVRLGQRIWQMDCQVSLGVKTVRMSVIRIRNVLSIFHCQSLQLSFSSDCLFIQAKSEMFIINKFQPKEANKMSIIFFGSSHCFVNNVMFVRLFQRVYSFVFIVVFVFFFYIVCLLLTIEHFNLIHEQTANKVWLHKWS